MTRLPGGVGHPSDVDRAIDIAYARGYYNGWQKALSALTELLMKRATKGVAKSAILRDIEDVRKVVGNG